MSSDSLSVQVEFGGGLELLFSNQRSHKITLPARISPDQNAAKEADPKDASQPVNLAFLLRYLRDNVLSDKRRVDLFMENDSIRPGILVLVNDSDWELEGESAYELKTGDEIVLISTLHGG